MTPAVIETLFEAVDTLESAIVAVSQDANEAVDVSAAVASLDIMTEARSRSRRSQSDDGVAGDARGDRTPPAPRASPSYACPDHGADLGGTRQGASLRASRRGASRHADDFIGEP